MVIQRCERTGRFMAYQNWQGNPCLADAETMGEAIDECSYLVGMVQVREHFKREGLREANNG